MDCEFIATGHYAKVKEEGGRYFVSKGLDPRKDQSYVLWGLSQECLARTMFPCAEFTKEEIRQMAVDYGYAQLALKPESYEICFVPDNDYRGFLKRRLPELEAKVNGGNFLNTQGEVIGTHIGYPFFTIGQRKGLGQAFGKPVYVTHIDPIANTVTLGDDKDLLRNGVLVSQINTMTVSYTHLTLPTILLV